MIAFMLSWDVGERLINSTSAWIAANRRLVGLDFFAHYDKTPLGLPVPKFKVQFSDAVDLINGLPLANLIEPALEVTG